MKLLLALSASLTLTGIAWSQQKVAEFNWNDVAQKGLPQGAVVSQMDGHPALKIDNTNNAPLRVTLLKIPAPKITSAVYAVQGQIKYDDVQGDGFLEMLNYFPPTVSGSQDGEYFSRTLGESGDMGKIAGTSDWREFSLPFNSTGATGAPTHLQINIVLQGRGAVYIGPLKLVQYSSAPSASPDHSEMVWFYGRTNHPWWSPRTAVWISNLETPVLLTAAFVIAGLCWKGKGEELVRFLFKLHIGLGIVCLAAGVAAFEIHQPFAVWFPLSLTGLLLASIYSGLFLSLNKYYRDHELRRMQSMDALG